MKEILVLLVLGFILPGCYPKEPLRPKEGVIPFMVHFSTRKRGICVGTLVSRMAVLTAAVCVVNLHGSIKNVDSVLLGPFDKEPINVITGTHYRHQMRGIKVQVTKIIIPKLPVEVGPRAYYLQKSAALLLLRRKVPDLLTEVPLRAIAVDYKGEDKISFQDECIVLGWHFFFTGENVLAGNKFILQRHLRYQQMILASKDVFCGALTLKYEKETDALGNSRKFVKNDIMCLRDPDYIAQPCHGSYGSPVICGSGRMVGMLMAPDAQWYNCTGYSVLTHELSNKRNKRFFECVSPLFVPEMRLNWAQIKMGHSEMYEEGDDVIRSFYDGIITDFSSSTEEIA